MLHQGLTTLLLRIPLLGSSHLGAQTEDDKAQQRIAETFARIDEVRALKQRNYNKKVRSVRVRVLRVCVAVPSQAAPTCAGRAVVMC